MSIAKKFFIKQRTNPIRVAIMSNGPELPTGYAKVLREISTRLHSDKRFEVIIFNENYQGNPTEWNGIPMVGVYNPDMGRIVESVAKAMEIVRPDVLIILEDSFTIKNFGFEQMMKVPCKRIFYLPLDGGAIPTTGINVLRSMDKIVSMAKFTQDELMKDGFESEMIWHGVDLNLFCPVSTEYQGQLKQHYGFNPDDFIIFNYGRNSLRKNNQSLLRVACKYLSTAPKNHKVFLHIMQKEDEHLNLIDYMERFMEKEFGKETTERVIFSKFSHQKPATDNEVASMIQMSDLIFSTTSGEGFGLIMAEGMSCAKPILHPDYTTPFELLIDESVGIGPRGWVVPIQALNVSSFNTEHSFVDHDAYVEIIKEAVNNPREMAMRGQNGRVFAERYLNWDYLTEQWKDLILKIC